MKNVKNLLTASVLIMLMLLNCGWFWNKKPAHTSGRFVSKTTIYEGKKAVSVMRSTMVIKGKKFKIETDMGAGMPGMSGKMTMYFSPGKAITYFPDFKLAYKMDIPKNDSVDRQNPFKWQEKMKKLNAKVVGKDKINGQMCTKYKYWRDDPYPVKPGMRGQVKQGFEKADVRVWLRDKDKMPVKIRMIAGNRSMVTVYSKIDIGGKVSDQEVSLPRGIKVVSQEEFMQEMMKGMMKGY